MWKIIYFYKNFIYFKGGKKGYMLNNNKIRIILFWSKNKEKTKKKELRIKIYKLQQRQVYVVGNKLMIFFFVIVNVTIRIFQKKINPYIYDHLFLMFRQFEVSSGKFKFYIILGE